MKNRFLAVLAFCSISSSALALDCGGHVNAVRVMKTGTLELKIDEDVKNNYINICSVATTYNEIAPETCKGWLAIALSARATGKKVKLWDVQGGICATGGSVVLEKFSMY